jgi:cyclohexa-1,5-dienecarbonyl-CoA hydratase
MTPSGETIRYELTGRVARVTLDRPPLNVLDLASIRALDAAVARAVEERASVLVVGAEGTRAFSAGVAVEDHAPERVRETLAAFHSVFRRLYRAPFVSVAKVRGRCLGGGCELALFCDIVVAADSAVFGLPEIDLACFPPVALAAFPYRFGRRALEIVLTGEPLSAEDAWRGGLVSRWTPRDELDGHVDELASRLEAKSAAALAVAVQTARKLWTPGFERSLDDAERAYLEGVVPLADHREGLAAFLEKRKPGFER